MSKNGIGQDYTEPKSDNDELDELNGYDGFGGDIELDETTNIDDNIQPHLMGVTHQTAV